MGRLASVPAFFGLRILSALFLLKLSAAHLPVAGFAVFSQFTLFCALLNLIAVASAQNGLVRQAAAARDPEALARTQSAALVVWGCVAAVAAVVLTLASPAVAHVLVGRTRDWTVVAAITWLALAAGPGQIWCSLLTGRGRVASSLAAQALGLIAGVSGAAILIVRGKPEVAAAAFAAGPVVTMAAAFLFIAPLRIGLVPLRAALAEAPALLRYSAASAATASFSAITLFGLRSLYREDFGPTALGYWMAANRISDMSTQLVGLFMIQVFVPQVAMTPTAEARRTLAIRCGALAALAMAAVATVFSLASAPLVHLLLSDAYLPAIPAIRTYMIGDVLRVWPLLAMYAAFADGRPGRYAAIEIGAVAVMAVITVGLVSAGQRQAPQLGYVAAYALAALIVTAALLAPRPALRAPA